MRPTSALDGPSPGTASSAAPNARRASSHWRARYAARPSEYLVRTIAVSARVRPAVHDLEDGRGLGLSRDYQPINFAYLISAPAAATVLRKSRSGSVAPICSFQARRQIHRVAHHGVAHHEFRADAADECFAGSDAYAEVKLDRDAAHTD